MSTFEDFEKKTTSPLSLEENPVTTSLSKGFIGWKTVIERRRAEDDFTKPGRVRDSIHVTKSEIEMILETTKGTANIPEGGISLTKEEALKLQKNIVESYSVKETFFLRYGQHIATAVTFLSSAACVNVFHPLLKFGSGTFSGVIPAILLPSALVYYKMDNVLTNEILTLRLDCPVCHHLKYLALQTYAGLIFPSFLGMLSTNAGHGVPYIKTDTSEYWRKTFGIAQTHKLIFQNVFFIQISLAFIVPYIQNYEISKIMEKQRVNSVEQVVEETL